MLELPLFSSGGHASCRTRALAHDDDQGKLGRTAQAQAFIHQGKTSSRRRHHCPRSSEGSADRFVHCAYFILGLIHDERKIECLLREIGCNFNAWELILFNPTLCNFESFIRCSNVILDYLFAFFWKEISNASVHGILIRIYDTTHHAKGNYV